MISFPIKEVQKLLPKLIHDLQQGGGEIAITDNGIEVAKIVPPVESKTETSEGKPRRMLGAQRGSVLFMAPDFDEPLEEFKEYME